jgi:cellulose synthase/poly-beta-1,6-N-acetylglucosamine synthase-like glycosyltransferase
VNVTLSLAAGALVPAPHEPALVLLAAAVAFLLATYAGYPLALALRARLAPRRLRPDPWAPLPTVTCLVAARDEGDALVEKVRALLAQDYPAALLDVVVADDASSDRAASRAVALDPARVRVASNPTHGGKAAALVRAAAIARGEVLLLCDVRQRFEPGVVRALAARLSDPDVGAVTGQLRLDGARGPGAYWRYETAIRVAEGRTGSVVGATGAIYAVRRRLFPAHLPAGTILDDVYVPAAVALAGKRVAYAEDAIAWDRELDVRHEFVRKVRTLAGNFQLLALLPELRNPLRSAFAWRFFWHKQARLVCPAALVAALVGSAAADGLVARALLAAQLALYALAALGQLLRGRGGRLVSLCHTFVALNVAAVWALWIYRQHEAQAAWVRTSTLGGGA